MPPFPKSYSPPRRPLPQREDKKKRKEDDLENDPTASSSTGPVLPYAGPSGEEQSDSDSDVDSQATLPYDEGLEAVVTDEAHWSYLTGTEKSRANAASFIFPMMHDCKFDVFTV